MWASVGVLRRQTSMGWRRPSAAMEDCNSDSAAGDRVERSRGRASIWIWARGMWWISGMGDSCFGHGNRGVGGVACVRWVKH